MIHIKQITITLLHLLHTLETQMINEYLEFSA